MNQPWVYMCSPPRTPLPPPSPSHPSGSSQCTGPKCPSHASNLDWWSISYMVIYMFQCYSLKSSHPRLLPQNTKLCSLHSWNLDSNLWFIQLGISHDILCIHKEGNGTPRQYSCLENPMDGGAWWAAVHGVAKSLTWLGDFTFTFHFHALEEEMETHSSVLAWRIPGKGGAWWAAVSGVAQSGTWLKWQQQ